MSAINQGRPPGRFAKIAGATALAAVSGWLALDYLGDTPLPGVADAVAVPVLQTTPATFNSVVAGSTTSTVLPGMPPRRVAKARTRRAVADPLSAEASPTEAIAIDAVPADPVAQTLGAPQPMMILPPPVAMLAAACALQQKLVEAAQVH